MTEIIELELDSDDDKIIIYDKTFNEEKNSETIEDKKSERLNFLNCIWSYLINSK